MPAPTFYPLHLRLEGRLCVVVGGGGVAERKIRALLAANARVLLVSPEATPELERLAQTSEIEWRRLQYTPEELQGATLVFAATNQRAINAQIAADAQARNLWVNVADAPDAGDFITPATLQRGTLILSVATGGASPALAAQIKQEWEERYSETYLAFLEICTKMRLQIKESLPLEARSAANRRLGAAEQEICALLEQGEREKAERRATEIVFDLSG